MINTDKAYLFGMLVGGGVFGDSDSSFVIQLPYKAWGEVAKNPARAGEIGTSILNVVKPILKGTYGIDCSYYISKGKWIITCDGKFDALKSELSTYGIDAAGELRKNANIDKLVAALTNDSLKRRFLSGMADTIGSLSPSQRRFTKDFAIVSFEFNGFNYNLIYNVCQLLCSLNLYPDQIEWNHPNFQSGDDAYYKSWKKGFKLRVALDDFSSYGKFLFTPKTEAMRTEIGKQTKGTNASVPCNEKEVVLKFGCTHSDENSSDLPADLRGYHFLNPKHVCSFLGCPYAPEATIKGALKNPEEYVTPFTVITKGTASSIQAIIDSDPFYSSLTFTSHTFSVKSIYDKFKSDQSQLVFGGKPSIGYPINNLIGAIAYILADESELFGKRVRKSQNELIESKLSSDPGLSVEILEPDLVSVLIVTSGGSKACLVGAKHPDLTKKLIVFNGSDGMLFKVRRPSRSDYDA